MGNLGSLAAVSCGFSFNGWPPREKLGWHNSEIPFEGSTKTWGGGGSFVSAWLFPFPLWSDAHFKCCPGYVSIDPINHGPKDHDPTSVNTAPWRRGLRRYPISLIGQYGWMQCSSTDRKTCPPLTFIALFLITPIDTVQMLITDLGVLYAGTVFLTLELCRAYWQFQCIGRISERKGIGESSHLKRENFLTTATSMGH